MRVAAAIFAVVFAVGAVVQWNDPDPLGWILGYSLGAVLSLGAALGRSFYRSHLAASIVFGLWFLWLAPSLVGAPSEAFASFEMKAGSHEEPREAGGLALLSGWNAVLAFSARRRSQRSVEPEGQAGTASR
jgi:hypothetical protein